VRRGRVEVATAAAHRTEQSARRGAPEGAFDCVLPYVLDAAGVRLRPNRLRKTGRIEVNQDFPLHVEKLANRTDISPTTCRQKLDYARPRRQEAHRQAWLPAADLVGALAHPSWEAQRLLTMAEDWQTRESCQTRSEQDQASDITRCGPHFRTASRGAHGLGDTEGGDARFSHITTHGRLLSRRGAGYLQTSGNRATP